MPYSALPAKSSTDTLTLTNYDAIKGNFEAGVPDIFTTKGDLAVATAADTAARLGVGADDSELTADASQSTGLAWQIRPCARVYNSAGSTPTTSTWTTITFNSERFDTDTVHSTSSNTGRLTIPSGGSGLYSIGGCVQIDASAVGVGFTAGLRILLNGTTVIAEVTQAGEYGSSLDTNLAVSTLYSLSATDYVELQVYTSQAANVNAVSNFSPEFWINFERRQ